MGTTGPTAGATHTATELGEGLGDTDVPCLGPLTRDDPTYPLIAS